MTTTLCLFQFSHNAETIGRQGLTIGGNVSNVFEDHEMTKSHREGLMKWTNHISRSASVHAQICCETLNQLKTAAACLISIMSLKYLARQDEAIHRHVECQGNFM